MEDKVYNGMCVRLDETDRYIIWAKEAEDGPVLDHDGEVVAFPSKEDLENYARRIHIRLQNLESDRQDLDRVQRWLMFPDSGIDCNSFLSACRMFEELSLTLNLRFSGNRKSYMRNGIYEKLFWGSTSHPEVSDQNWSPEEMSRLRCILMEGLSLVRGHVRFCA